MKKLIFLSLFIFCFQNINSMESQYLDDIFADVLENAQGQDDAQVQVASKELEYDLDSESIYEYKEEDGEELPFPGDICGNFDDEEIKLDEIKLPEITSVSKLVEQPENQVCLNLDIEPIDSLFEQAEKQEKDPTSGTIIKLKIPRKRPERSSSDGDGQTLNNKRIRESDSELSNSDFYSDSDSESACSEFSSSQSDEESFADENETLFNVIKCDDKKIKRTNNTIKEVYKGGIRYLKCGFPGCGKIYTKLSSVKDHIRAQHINDRPYECSICHKKFSRKNVLREHMLIHSKKKPHKCSICGHRFVRKGFLVEHMVTHTLKKNFVCKKCGRSYSTGGSLARHRRINH